MNFLNLSIYVTILTLLIIISLICYCKWCFTYWKRKKIPSPKPTIPLGNMAVNSKLTAMHLLLKFHYDEMKADGHKKHFGMYVFIRPVYVVMEPEYIKTILSRDFQYFADRGIYHNERDDPIGSHILVLEGQKWKRLRTKFTPTFTSAKMKMMFDTLTECANQMLASVNRLKEKPVDIKEVSACYTTDVIGSCVFGINCNSFAANEAEFRKYGRKLFKMSRSLVFRVIFCSSFKSLAKTLRMKIIDTKASSFFFRVIESTLKYREENDIVRNDFLQLLMNLRKEDREGLGIEEIAAQCFLFFGAGFETSSTTMTFCIYELAHDQTIQTRVREEIEEVISENGGELTYETVMNMKYLDQVVDETLRKHPSVPNLPRICTRDYKTEDTLIEAGTQVFIPVYALHRDPELYPDPEKFDPDRFTEENKLKRHPYAYLPFGEGPRICLGQRFGLLQVKIGLITLLRNYVFTPNRKTGYPIQYDKNNLFLTSRGSVWIEAKCTSG